MRILHRLAELLTKDGIPLELGRNQLVILIRDGVMGRCITVTRRAQRVVVQVSFPLVVPGLRHNEVKQAVTLLNREIESGAFVLAADGQVRFRNTMQVSGRPYEAEEVKALLFAAWKNVAIHSTALVEVALGHRKPSTVLDSDTKKLPADLREAVHRQR